MSSLTHHPPISSVHPSRPTPSPSSTPSQTLPPPPLPAPKRTHPLRPIQPLQIASDHLTSLPGANIVLPLALTISQGIQGCVHPPPSIHPFHQVSKPSVTSS